MRLCKIGWADVAHGRRWVQWFARRGHEVHLITNRVAPVEGVHVHSIAYAYDSRPRFARYRDLSFHSSWSYYFKCPVTVRQLVRDIRPDILHSHTLWFPGYLGLYTGFQPYLITVLDGDVLWTKEDATWFHKLRTRYACGERDL